ncbi:SRPBCC family protein [Amycolatopsis sp. NPDC059021]|uniref:SRPBCC family protein n=1 Tax=Amycolatopsis sp. NPDC059021 TaxID=3346704 RepID=UPI00367107C8
MSGSTQLKTVDERPVLRFERRLAHSPEKVWHTITDPAELAHWFPAAVSGDLRPGGVITFTFEGQDESTDGEVLTVAPPKEFAFSWNSDVLRWVLTPDGDGCLLEFTHTFGRGESAIARLAAGRNAAGWDTCLDALDARLSGETPEQPTNWHDRMAAYVEEWHLGEGEVVDGVIRFRRDLVWKPVEEVWALLAPESLKPGDTAPASAGNGRLAPGEVTIADAPRVLEFSWLHNGKPAGTVRWEIVRDELDGVRAELTQTLPEGHPALATELAAWHERMAALFAATFGVEPEPWPADRVEALTEHYAKQGL